MPAPSVCAVCNWRGEDDVCPRCGTVVRAGGAKCSSCGKEFSGPIARCDACWGSLPALVDAPADTLRRLTQMPGIDDGTARWLYGHGYADPSDVLKLGLSDRAVRLGLHRTLARKINLGEMRNAPRIRKEVPCAVCLTPKPSASAACPACGVRAERQPTMEEIEGQLAQVVGEVDDLASDPDFREMPTDLRDEILDAFDPIPGASPAGTSHAQQFEEWRSHGIDTSPLEHLLREEGEEAFRGKFAGIVRGQVAKRMDGPRSTCAICEEEVAPGNRECDNCGAKLG